VTQHSPTFVKAALPVQPVPLACPILKARSTDPAFAHESISLETSIVQLQRLAHDRARRRVAHRHHSDAASRKRRVHSGALSALVRARLELLG
jgi:hypothetical protein